MRSIGKTKTTANTTCSVDIRQAVGKEAAIDVPERNKWRTYDDNIRIVLYNIGRTSVECNNEYKITVTSTPGRKLQQ